MLLLLQLLLPLLLMMMRIVCGLHKIYLFNLYNVLQNAEKKHSHAYIRFLEYAWVQKMRKLMQMEFVCAVCAHQFSNKSKISSFSFFSKVVIYTKRHFLHWVKKKKKTLEKWFIFYCTIHMCLTCSSVITNDNRNMNDFFSSPFSVFWLLLAVWLQIDAT